MLLVGTSQYIIQTKQRYEVIDEYGNFICSGDTRKECEEELIKMIMREYVSHIQQVI